MDKRTFDSFAYDPRAVAKATRGLSPAAYARVFRAAVALYDRAAHDLDLDDLDDRLSAYRLRHGGRITPAEEQAFLDGNSYGDEGPYEVLAEHVEQILARAAARADTDKQGEKR